MNECTYWEYPGGGEPPSPCPKAADRGSVYCKDHRAIVAGNIARAMQRVHFTAREAS